MKNRVEVVAFLFMLMGLVSCGGEGAQLTEDEKLYNEAILYTDCPDQMVEHFENAYEETSKAKYVVENDVEDGGDVIVSFLRVAEFMEQTYGSMDRCKEDVVEEYVDGKLTEVVYYRESIQDKLEPIRSWRSYIRELIKANTGEEWLSN